MYYDTLRCFSLIDFYHSGFTCYAIAHGPMNHDVIHLTE
jgi:hypothetical protein